MNKHLWTGFIETVKKEVVPALGCTEPVSVALAAAIATRNLKGKPNRIDAFVSPNLMKNGMGVGVPGTGMVGLPIAAAVGALAGEPEAELEVLKNITEADVEQAKLMLEQHQVCVGVAKVTNILFAKVTVSDGTDEATVIIADGHTQVVSIEVNGKAIFIADPQPVASNSDQPKNIFSEATAHDIYEFALNVPIEDIQFIVESLELNDALSREGLTGKYGLQIGATFQRNVDRGLLSGGLLTDVLRRTSAASDARMDGAMKPAMSNSGSGNQGIAATMPVVVVAEHLKADADTTARALMMSHLMAIYIKSYQNKLSALCGATTASMGAVAGMTWLLGGRFEQISAAICSMIGDITGIICDGAKTSCAMKVSSSASAAVKAALMALDGIRVTGSEGIVADDVDTSIRNMSALANGAMTQTDVQILDIMVHK
ncbi:L-serine ammonia-lyase, iron-sulfur-dependent, subunit alpha [Photobacterium sp. SDRW27]|uniref:L-cysteine desulfidase family protein n=1 Tax=Photobacterium obscurum TaxID=2829490 RepID=UPI002244EA96|nr:L-serine ammonia-lyase, iron-sulfur-dependent, subunit alpha [Photobacterium obscurum]MCW8328561.1 L-serine ammonia-lyase, iron-sulfur-dependent, subunit alpha [Photobacterium obscurum]